MFALVRGGVPVGAEVAKALGAPLEVLVVRKVGAPLNPEFGIGAVGEGGLTVTNPRALELARVDEERFEGLAAREREELERRVRVYRGDGAPPPLGGRTAILVDDGLATGVSARTGVRVLRHWGARRVVLAVPVGAPDSARALEQDADEVVCLEAPPHFAAVGTWYADFRQVSDDEVVHLLDEARAREVIVATGAAAGSDSPPPPTPAPPREVSIPADEVGLPGSFARPPGSIAVVAFAHGSGSSRLSPRNTRVAETLQRAGLATLLFDLLTPTEADDRANVFDIPLLGRRLLAATRWLRQDPGAPRPLGYFGASTGAAAALWAAAEPGNEVGAVVSRGGRPDLTGDRLPAVRAPTLLLVGERDDYVLSLNEEARAQMPCQSELVVVPGATHLFEEPGALEAVAGHARDWFARHLTAGAQPPGCA